MLRKLLLIMGCAAMATLFVETIIVGMLWWKGSLSDHNLREIQLILNGELPEDAAPSSGTATPTKSDQPQVAYEAVKDTRAMRILDLQNRESNLAALRQQILDDQKRVQERQEAFETERATFEKKLQDLEKSLNDAGTEQARGVLLALPPQQAAERLMSMTLDEGLGLLKGLPDKSVAKILKEFAGTEKKVERGQQLFRAIYKGDPQQALVSETQARLAPPAASRP